MNESEYLDNIIEIETAYTEGFRTGKQAAAEQIFTDIGKLLDANFSDSYGTYDGKLGIAIWKLKEKYGVK